MAANRANHIDQPINDLINICNDIKNIWKWLQIISTTHKFMA